METNRKRICICYVITTLLISIFIYMLLSSNLQNMRAVSRLREEVDEIAHVVLHSAPGKGGQSQQLSEVIDGILKKKLAGIWDDLYTVKKQLKATECATVGGRKSSALGEKGEDSVNYASEDLGAKITAVIADAVDGTNIFKSLLRLDFSSNPPVNMLRQSMEPGSCFGFKNNESEVTVRLAKEIYVESIAVEHIAKSLSPTGDTTSAPRAFEVYGVDTKCAGRVTSPPLLGIFEYENAARIQIFNVKLIAKFRTVRFKFVTNHGNPDYTCVYRVAVYGRMN